MNLMRIAETTLFFISNLKHTDKLETNRKVFTTSNFLIIKLYPRGLKLTVYSTLYSLKNILKY